MSIEITNIDREDEDGMTKKRINLHDTQHMLNPTRALLNAQRYGCFFLGRKYIHSLFGTRLR